MSQIKLKHSGGNGVIIAAPSSNPASDRTLTLPSDADGTIVSKDSSNNVAEIASINGGSIGTKNLLHNGNFSVAQRATSSTSSGYVTVDRWQINHSVQSNPTSALANVASGTTPYTLGFRKALKITNGNQSNGPQANSIFYIRQFIESQDVATSGWNYTDPNSKITLSFWIKSSVAQSFHGHMKTQDGTAQLLPFQTGVLTANTWTKITKVIPGNANLQFDTDTTANRVDRGLIVVVAPYMGTNYTSSSAVYDQWTADSSGIFAGQDMTTTWFTTNASTLEFTGFQLEVGSTASAFAFETQAETLRKCQRYLYVLNLGSNAAVMNFQLHRLHYNTGAPHAYVTWPVPMRTAPSMTKDGTSYSGGGYQSNISLGTSKSSAGILVGDTATPAGSSDWHRVNNVSGSTLRYLFSADL
jgi:hypothetical protein|tara:strand:- start:231 stop:1472 length:1242 start_codon:yes stop_codon:yes gene_type:complete